MDNNSVIEVAEKLYREANPNGTMDTPSFAYEQVSMANVRRLNAASGLSLYDWCKMEIEKRNKLENKIP